jgi:tRNA(Ile)-lysidine synthase
MLSVSPVSHTDSTDWQTGAAALAVSVPLTALDGEAADALAAEASPTGARVAVACSGGVDSVAALLLVWAHFPALHGRLTVLHFNHGTRADCAAEAAFVESVASALGEQFTSGVIAVGAVAQGEAGLREHRLAFFKEACAAAGARMLVQGHQADDVVETVLMRLARGVGAAGLSAPRPVQHFADGRVFVRPLLALEKAALVAAMRAAGLPWCEDASNGTDAFLRNRIRRAVTPAWAEASGGAPTAGVLRSRRLLAEDDAALEAWAEAAWGDVRKAGGGVGRRFDWALLAGSPAAVHRRVLWRVLAALTPAGAAPVAPAAAAVDALVAALAAGCAGQWSAGHGWLIFDGEVLSFESDATAPVFCGTGALCASGGVSLHWPTGATLEAQSVPLPMTLLAEICAGKFSPSAEVFLAEEGVTSPLFARFWNAGDAFRPLGAAGGRKLSDVFIDKKIPVAERGQLPVICDDAGIVWVPGLPPAHRCRLTALSETALRLTWTPPPVVSPLFSEK